MTVKEAKALLKEIGLDLKINNSEEKLDTSKAIITDQTPKEGITQQKDGYIVCEVNQENS